MNGLKVVESAQLVYRLHPDLSVNSFKMEMAYWSAMPPIVQQQYMVLKNVQVRVRTAAVHGTKKTCGLVHVQQEYVVPKHVQVGVHFGGAPRCCKP